MSDKLGVLPEQPPVPERVAIAAIGTLVAYSVQATVAGTPRRNELLDAAWRRHKQRFASKPPGANTEPDDDFTHLTAESQLPQLNSSRMSDTEWLETVVPQLAVPPLVEPWRVVTAETGGPTCAGDRFPQSHWNGRAIAYTDGMGTSPATGRVLRAAAACMLRILEKLPAALPDPLDARPVIATMAILASGKSVDDAGRLRELLSLSAVRQMAMVLRSAFAGAVSAAVADACATKWEQSTAADGAAASLAVADVPSSGEAGDTDATVTGDNAWGLWPDDGDEDPIGTASWSASAETVVAAGGGALDAVRFGFGWAALSDDDHAAAAGAGRVLASGVRSGASEKAGRGRRGLRGVGAGSAAGDAPPPVPGAASTVGLTPEVAVTRVRRVMRTALLSEGVAGPVEAARGKVSAEAAAGLAKVVEAVVGELTVRALGLAGEGCEELGLRDVQSALQRWPELDFASAVVGPVGVRAGEWTSGRGVLLAQNHVVEAGRAASETEPLRLPRAWGLVLTPAAAAPGEPGGVSEVVFTPDAAQPAAARPSTSPVPAAPPTQVNAATAGDDCTVVATKAESSIKTERTALGPGSATVAIKEEEPAPGSGSATVAIKEEEPVPAGGNAARAVVNWHDPPAAPALALAGLAGPGAQLWTRPDLRVLAVTLTEAEAEAAGRSSALATLVAAGVLPVGAADCAQSVLAAARSAASAAIREFQELEEPDSEEEDGEEDVSVHLADAGTGGEAAAGLSAACAAGVSLAMHGVDATVGAGAVAHSNAAEPHADLGSGGLGSGGAGGAPRHGEWDRPRALAPATPAERIAKRSRLAAAQAGGAGLGLGTGWTRLVREACASVAAGRDWSAKADRAARRAEAQQRQAEARAQARTALHAQLRAQAAHLWTPAAVAAALSWGRPWHQRAAAVAAMAQTGAAARGLAKPACYAAGSAAATALARRLQARGLTGAALQAQAVGHAITIFGGLDKPLPQAMGLTLSAVSPAASPGPLLTQQVADSVDHSAAATSAVELPPASTAAAAVAPAGSAPAPPASSPASAAASQAAPGAALAALSPADRARAMQHLLSLPAEARARLSPLQQQQVLVLQHVQLIHQLRALLQAGQLHQHPAALKVLGSQQAVEALGRGEAEAVAEAGQKLANLLAQTVAAMQRLQR